MAALRVAMDLSKAVVQLHPRKYTHLLELILVAAAALPDATGAAAVAAEALSKEALAQEQL